MTHLGLDLSLTATGWAIIQHLGTRQTTGTFGDDTDDHISLRLRRWAGELNSIIPYARPLHIVVEDLPRSVKHGGPALGMVHAMFWKTLAERCIHYDAVTTVPPGTLKMYATGKGNASKSLVLVEAVKRLGYDGHDDNEADALWLADLGARIHGYDRPALPATHLKALDKIRPKASA